MRFALCHSPSLVHHNPKTQKDQQQMIQVLSGIFGLAIVIGAVVLWNIIPYRRRVKRFKGREELSLDTIYTRFYAQTNLPKGLVLELWNEVAARLKIPAGKLRPSDRFDREFAPVKGWEFDDESAEINWAAAHRLQTLGVKADLSRIQSLGDYVEFFGKLELDKRQRASVEKQ
jgi:hypothetical protein